MTSIDHLHSECQLLPVKDHNEMLSRQFYLGAYLPNHPDHHTTTPPAFRTCNLRHTLHSKYNADVSVFIPDNGLCNAHYRRGIKAIHRTSVADAVQGYTPPVWLGGFPPPAPTVSAAEKQLGRKARSTLAQLRSGYSSMLNSYVSRIDPTVANTCPSCQQGPHDTAHLFNCPAHPTQLKVDSLWTQPVAASCFLGLNDENIDDDD